MNDYRAMMTCRAIPTVSSTGSAGMGDLGDAIGDVGEELDDANGKAKKLKSNLLGIDELNVINSDNDSGSGASGLGAGVGGALTDALDGILAEYDNIEDLIEDENNGDGN